MKTKLFTSILFVLAFAFISYAQTQKTQQPPNKTTLTKEKSSQRKGVKNVTVNVPGTLETLLSPGEIKTVSAIAISGTVNASDIYFMRDNMPKLTSVDLSAASIAAYGKFPADELPYGAFMGMNKLQNVLLPPSTTAIGYNGFYGCVSLKSLTLPASVKRIAGQAFYNTGITNINIPDSLTKGIVEFRSLDKLKNIDVSFYNKRFSLYCGVVYNRERDTLFFCPRAKTGPMVEIHEITEVICESAFDGCRGLTGVLGLPITIKKIGAYAFRDCTGLGGELDIPRSTEKIGTGAFDGCNFSKINNLSDASLY